MNVYMGVQVFEYFSPEYMNRCLHHIEIVTHPQNSAALLFHPYQSVFLIFQKALSHTAFQGTTSMCFGSSPLSCCKEK